MQRDGPMDAHFVDDEYGREGCIAINDVKVREVKAT